MRAVVLCGPPCAGKTTLAHHLAGPGDVVLDFDDIARAMGSPDWWIHPEPYRTMAEQHMQARILAAITGEADGTAWIIRTAPRPHHRARLAQDLDAQVYVLNPGQAECVRRAAQRPRGTRHAIGSWYHHYRPWSGDRDATTLTAATG